MTSVLNSLLLRISYAIVNVYPKFSSIKLPDNSIASLTLSSLLASKAIPIAYLNY
jgi:hypothetical protein